MKSGWVKSVQFSVQINVSHASSVIMDKFETTGTHNDVKNTTPGHSKQNTTTVQESSMADNAGIRHGAQNWILQTMHNGESSPKRFLNNRNRVSILWKKYFQ